MRKFLSYLKRLDHIKCHDNNVTLKQVAEIAAQNPRTPHLFESVENYKYRLATNVLVDKKAVASHLRVSLPGLIRKKYFKKSKLKIVDSGPCFEIHEHPALSKIPILQHSVVDKGPYITGGVVIAYDDELKYNLSFHRMMVISEDEVAVQLSDGSHLLEFYKRSRRNLRIAIAIGASPAIMLAAGTRFKIGSNDEYEYAGLIDKDIELAYSPLNKLLVPSEAEMILEGEITDTMIQEGPFLDYKGDVTYGGLQPVVKIYSLTHRRDPIYHTIFGYLDIKDEHKVLMTGIDKNLVLESLLYSLRNGY